MGKKKKLRDRFFATPVPTDIEFGEVCTIMQQYGFELVRSAKHHIFRHTEYADIFVPPISTIGGRKVLAAYVKIIKKAIIEVEEKKKDE